MEQGSEDEFVAYVAGSSAYLRSTAFVLRGDWHRADDLLQVTFLKLYRVWPRLVRRGELDGYARRMVVRAFPSGNRRKWRSREHLPGELPDGPAAPESDHAQRLSVRTALDGVPPKQRAVLVLRYWDDLSVEETAEVLGRHREEPVRAGPGDAAQAPRSPFSSGDTHLPPATAAPVRPGRRPHDTHQSPGTITHPHNTHHWAATTTDPHDTHRPPPTTTHPHTTPNRPSPGITADSDPTGVPAGPRPPVSSGGPHHQEELP
ncbi:SigE family RNA polymerase sigma factor [Amycolatopsis saalfeldensis]|uniref:RNA polymerase sigma factor, sigma-70 family n=1 Tax=Amycolatopsis saalfeldensis TaxID=394193 RepID=A0A1H8YHV1_9PSEU|nr:RNA polymerase sigma factor, sigma-70 family [Amycolatopsis saalfeldensis]